MEKLGYVILISMYFVSFTIGKNLSTNLDGKMLDNIRHERLIEDVSSAVARAIGMDALLNSIADEL